MAEQSAAWPALTVVSGPEGAGKTHLVQRRTDPARRVWLSLRGEPDSTELASRLVRHLRARLPLPSSLAAATGPSCGPVSDADPLGRAEQLGSLVARELDTVLHRPLVLVLDELEHVQPASGSSRLIEALVRNAPAHLSLVLITRDDIPFSITRLRGDDRLHEITADQLRLDDTALVALVTGRFPDLDDAAEAIAGTARGRPGTALAVAGLLTALDPDDRASTLEQISTSTDPAAAALRRRYELLADRDREIVDDLAVLGDATAAELDRLVPERSAADTADRISRLVTARLIEDHPMAGGHVHLTRAAAAIVALDPEHRHRRAADAVQLAVGRGDPGAAMVAAARHGDADLLTATVTRYGAAAVAAGHAHLVLDSIAALDHPPSLRGLAGRAAQALGDWQRALVEYRAAAEFDVRAGDAWRHGLIEYFQGDTTAAKSVYEHALDHLDEDRDEPGDRATLIGYAGATAWLTGDLERARADAQRSLQLATEAQDDGAMAVAYTLAAMVAASDGDRVSNDWHYVRALQHAERAGDLLQIARIRSNRGSRLMEEGDYEAALDELDEAVGYADLGGYGVMLALALTNRGEVTTKLGRLDDARTDLTTAADLLQRQGSRIVAYPLVQLARLFLVRGDLEQARGSCERALALSEPSADQQLGASAHVQLARALAERDPDAAADIAQRAAETGSLDAPEAWSVVGMLAVQRGEHEAGAAAATTAADLARARRDRYALATALEVGALAEADPAVRRRRLEESFTLFDELGCPIDAGRVEVRLAADRLDSFAVTRVAAVAELAQRLGARPLLAQAEEVLSRFAAGGDHRLTVTVLGSFAVALDGRPIQHQAWQSKKARDLFKMLLVLRGRPLPREQAIDRLWPGDDPAKVSNKLSVALATIRSVLDPGKEFPSDHYVRAEGDAVLVDTNNVTTDVDRFLSMADAAMRELRRSPSSRAAGMLAAVESAYTGDVFEDDPYIDWFVPLREEARATYLSVTRELATLCSDRGDLDDAIRLLLRVLEREPYDESAHLALVTALGRVGRHGDARRRYQHYADRMRELELEPRSFPSSSGPT